MRPSRLLTTAAVAASALVLAADTYAAVRAAQAQ